MMSSSTPSRQRKRDKIRGFLSPSTTLHRSLPPSLLGLPSSTKSPQQSTQQLPPSPSPAPSGSANPVYATPSSILPSTPSQQQHPSGSSSATLSTSVTIKPVNPVFEVALQRHIDKLPEAEKHAYSNASSTITQDNLLLKIKELDVQHAVKSSFRPYADRMTKFLGLLDRILGGVVVAIQANPDISSIAVGGVKLIVDIAIGFSKFFSKLMDMIGRLTNFLAPLERYSERFDLINVGNALVDVYGDILDFCRAAGSVFLDKSGNAKDHTTVKLFLRLQWEPFESKFGEIAEQMDRHCSVLLHAAQAELLSANKSAQMSAQAKEREDFLRWLSSYDFQHKQYETFKSKHQGTGDWLLDTDEFQTWVNATSSQLLWCYGKPGAGKSVLASNAIDDLQRRFDEKQIGLCFAYYSFRDPSFSGLTALIPVLLKQLCNQQEGIPAVLLNAKQRAQNPDSIANCETFVSVAETLQQVFVVIDGLDECPEAERSPVLEFIAQVSNNARLCVKVLVCSRKEGDISTHFKAVDAPVIEVETGKVTLDVEHFVRDEATRLRIAHQLRVESDVLFDEIVDTLIQKSDGMFLWVSLHLKHLCKVSRTGKHVHVKEALEDMPQGLDAVYTRIFNSISKEPLRTRQIALEAFRWIRYARRPLSQSELTHIIALLDSPKSLEELTSRLLAPSEIYEICGNLLSSDVDLLFSKVNAVHFSFLEFLQKLPLNDLEGQLWKGLEEKHDVECVMACRCIDWLLVAAPDVSEDGTSPSFDQSRSPDYLIWTTELRHVPGLQEIWTISDPPQFALHFAARFGSISELKNMISRGHDINECDEAERTPLWHACNAGKLAQAELLLCTGALPDSHPWAPSPLGAATSSGAWDIVKLLLSYNADPTTNVCYKENIILHQAVADNQIEVARAFLRAGIDVNALHSDSKGTPIMRVESMEMARLLCEEYKADLDIVDSEGLTAAHHLIWGDSSETKIAVLQYLIDQGANPLTRSKAGLNVADLAICRASPQKFLESLLDCYPQLTTRAPNEWTLLHWACRSGEFKTVKLLLDRGLKATMVTTVDPCYVWTPYDIVMLERHDRRNERFRGEQMAQALGRTLVGSKTIHGTSVNSSQTAPKLSMYHVCESCYLEIYGCIFECRTCQSELCFMCSHSLHPQQDNHDIVHVYELAHDAGDGSDKSYMYEVESDRAFDYNGPEWEKWLQKAESIVQTAYEEDVRNGTLEKRRWPFNYDTERLEVNLYDEKNQTRITELADETSNLTLGTGMDV